jgi:hypothetical protein
MVGVAETTNDSNQSGECGRHAEGLSGGQKRPEDSSGSDTKFSPRAPDGRRVARWIEGGRSVALLQFGRQGFRIHCGDGPNDKTLEDLMSVCRHMRSQGVAGHWAYDLPLHRQLLAAFALEQAAIKVTVK